MIHRAHPVGIGEWRSLCIGDRHDRHVGILPEYRDQFRKVQAPMKGREYRRRATATHRKTQKIQMRMNDIELVRLRSEGLLLHEDERRITIDEPGIQPEGMWTGGPEISCGGRISTGKECDLVTLTNQFFCNIGDDPLRASVQSRRHAFPKGGDLCDLHGNILSLLSLLCAFIKWFT